MVCALGQCFTASSACNDWLYSAADLNGHGGGVKASGVEQIGSMQTQQFAASRQQLLVMSHLLSALFQSQLL